MSRNKKIKRELEQMNKTLALHTYLQTKARLENEYYMRCDRNFSKMLRRGEVCIGGEN